MAQLDSFWAGARAVADLVDVSELAERAGGWSALRAASVDDWMAWGASPAAAHAWASARPETTSGQVLTLDDPAYPTNLRGMPRPPPVLCVEGDLAALSRPMVAIVGTRACTRYGASVARRMGEAFAAAGWTVVSGLARGIDGEAHRGALASGRTVAVFGHGLDHTAPQRHRGLREQIVASGGAVLSAWPDAWPPRPHTFPKRNAWIAGLCSAVCIVEAPFRSGAMHTARFAAAMGREVLAVPGRIGDDNAQGPNALLSEGAIAVTSVREIVASITGTRRAPQEAWLDAVLGGAPIDQAAERVGRPVTWVLSQLSTLEVAGRVVRLPGGRYALAEGGVG